METITRDELEQKFDRGDDLALIEVLPESAFENSHIPGALNAPLDDRFADRIRGMVPDKSRAIVVYCANEECNASPRAAHKLDELGYDDVYDYAAGKEDWKDAGLPLDRRAARGGHHEQQASGRASVQLR